MPIINFRPMSKTRLSRLLGAEAGQPVVRPAQTRREHRPPRATTSPGVYPAKITASSSVTGAPYRKYTVDVYTEGRWTLTGATWGESTVKTTGQTAAALDLDDGEQIPTNTWVWVVDFTTHYEILGEMRMI